MVDMEGQSVGPREQKVVLDALDTAIETTPE